MAMAFVTAAQGTHITTANAATLRSPDGKLELTFGLTGNGEPTYMLDREGKPIIMPSKMGFTLEWCDDLAHAFVLKDVSRSTFDEMWQPVWGEEAHIRNHYNEMVVTLRIRSASVSTPLAKTLAGCP